METLAQPALGTLDRSPDGAVAAAAPPSHEEPRHEDIERLFATALPADWALIGRCRTGTGAADDLGGCFVLAHAAVGVALVDLAPCTTPDAELRLRRLLNLVDFPAGNRGYLPIVHCRIGADATGGLGRHLDAAFAYEPRLSIRQRTTWVAALRRVLRSSGTWEAIGRPLPIFSGQDEDEPSLRPKRRLAPRSLLAVLALLATFGVGVASGLLWVPPAGPARHSAEAGGGPGTVPRPPMASPPSSMASPMTVAPPAAAPEPAASPAGDAGRLAGQGSQASPSLVPETPRLLEPPSLPVLAPTLLSASVRGGSVSAATEADPGAGLTGAVPQPVASEAAAAAGVPPPRRAREPLPIDRRCSDAVFRYQQGGSLSQDEMVYVRRGCASWR